MGFGGQLNDPFCVSFSAGIVNLRDEASNCPWIFLGIGFHAVICFLSLFSPFSSYCSSRDFSKIGKETFEILHSAHSGFMVGEAVRIILQTCHRILQFADWHRARRWSYVVKQNPCGSLNPQSPANGRRRCGSNRCAAQKLFPP